LIREPDGTGAGPEPLSLPATAIYGIWRGDGLYASAAQDQVYRSDDGGKNWTPLGASLPYSAVQAMAIAPTGEMFAGDLSDPLGVYVSRDRGDSWGPLAGSPLTQVYRLKWLDDRLLVGTQDDGLWQWTPDGQWTHVLSEPVQIQAIAGVGNTVFAGGSGGIFRIEPGRAPARFALDGVSELDVAMDGNTPVFLAAGTSGDILVWRMNEPEARVLIPRRQLGGSQWVAEARFKPGTTTHYWIGAERGLYRATLRRWYE
jgi:hypothetical protein